MVAGSGRTDTHPEPEDVLVRRVAARNRRIHAAAAGVLAAAVVLVSAVSLRPDGEADLRTIRIMPSRSTGPMNADEQLAHDFVSTWFAYDRPLASSYLATGVASTSRRTTQTPGADVPWRQNRLDEALGSAFRVDGCYQIGTPSPDSARVGCLYTVDLLGLSELGRGPFSGNLFLVSVQDGQVVDFFTALGANDYDEVGWGPFLAWVEDGHDRGVPDLDALDNPEVTAREVGRTIRFWQRMGRDYVAALRSGEVT